MNETERIAEKHLIKMKWNPIKIHSTRLYNQGFPDFKCNYNRYVEVKRISESMLHFNFTQIQSWYSLLKEGKKVFLMIFSKENKYLFMFELTNKEMK